VINENHSSSLQPPAVIPVPFRPVRSSIRLAGCQVPKFDGDHDNFWGVWGFGSKGLDEIEESSMFLSGIIVGTRIMFIVILLAHKQPGQETCSVKCCYRGTQF
jgi:hypothetical protein